MLQQSGAVVANIFKVAKIVFATVLVVVCYSLIISLIFPSNETDFNGMRILPNFRKHIKTRHPFHLTGYFTDKTAKAFLDILNLPVSKQLNVPGSYNSPIMIPNLQTLLCWIPKNMCTQLKAISCRASLPKNSSMHKLINDDLSKVHGLTCFGMFLKFWHLNVSERAEVLTNKSWHRLAILRNPFDKFISGWINKCSIDEAAPKLKNNNNCYQCNASLECFIMKHYQYIQEQSKYGKSTIPAIKHLDHFAPQYWFCDFAHHLESYTLIKYEHSEDFKTIFRKRLEVELGFPDWLTKTGWGENMSSPFLGSKTKHISNYSAVIEAKKLIERNTTLADFLFRTYFIDFTMFGFTLPAWTIANCNKTSKLLICSWNNSDHP